jgi:hypothetical protein
MSLTHTAAPFLVFHYTNTTERKGSCKATVYCVIQLAVMNGRSPRMGFGDSLSNGIKRISSIFTHWPASAQVDNLISRITTHSPAFHRLTGASENVQNQFEDPTYSPFAASQSRQTRFQDIRTRLPFAVLLAPLTVGELISSIPQ